MKFNRIFAVVALAAALVASSCDKYDDSELVGRVDNLDSKVEVLEGKVTNLEGALSSLRNAVENKYAVESVEKTENGWIINFTNGKNIELVNGKDGQNGQNGENGKDGQNGENGKDGKDGDSFLKSVEENAEFVIITLNDENSTVFKLPKQIKVVIGDEESSYILIDDENNEVALEVPALENIVAVSGTVYSSTGSTTDVVITKANEAGWIVKIAEDYSYATIIADGAPKGSRALFVVTVTKADGTTFTSSKPIIYFMTDDTAYEQFFIEFESLQQNWTMINNYINDNEDFADEKYNDLKDEASVALQGVYMNMQTKQTWADESYNNGTLAADLDEILASFEEINIQLTQVKNTFDDGVKAIANDEAFELFQSEYEGLQKNWTMVNNYINNNEEFEGEEYEAAKDEATVALSGVAQNIETKMTWATESYDEGTLADDIEEILSTFEEINIQLTQIKNVFDEAVATLNQEKAYELFASELEGLQKNWTMVNNYINNNEEFEGEEYNELKDAATVSLSAVAQNIEAKQTWAQESYEAGTLAEDIEEILSTFEEINIQLTQIKNVFDDGVAAIKEDKAYELFASELEQLQKNVTMARNVTLNNEENEPYITEEIEDQALAYLSAIDQTIATKQTWAEESYNAGTLAADLDEILSTFEEVNILLTQYMNWFNDQMSAAHNDAAMEELTFALEGLQKQLTQMMNSTVYYEEDAAWLTEESLNSFISLFNGISQQIDDLKTWTEESWAKGSLADEMDQIYMEMEPIQIYMTQVKNSFYDAVDQAKNDSAFEAFFGEYEMYQMQITNLVKLANEAENEEALSAISAVSQQLETLMTWATESYEAGTLFDEYEEIVSNFPGIQTLINQVKNTYFAD